jgi:hypothetical protein
VQVHVTDDQSWSCPIARLLAGHGGKQAVEIQGVRAPGVLQGLGPALAWPIGGQLDAVAVGIGKVDGLVGAVVGGALHLGSWRRQTQHRARQLLA